jgi:tetratricopeptide (TPR) repeat protein
MSPSGLTIEAANVASLRGKQNSVRKELMPKALLPAGTGMSVGRVDVLLARARAAQRKQQWAEAIGALRLILAVDPLHIDAINLLAVSYGNVGDAQAALGYAEKSLRMNPEQPEMWENTGRMTLLAGEPESALFCFERLVELTPESASARVHYADALFHVGRFAESAAIYEGLKKAAPSHAAGYGNALNASGRHHEALAAYDQALSLPNASLATWMNKAMLLMRLGDLAKGLPMYERRWELPGLNLSLPSSKPLWAGQTSLASKTLYIPYEQGFGDTLHFCRYATLAASAGARVIVGAQRPLVRLIRTLASVTQIVTDDEHVPDHDLHCPMMSLPLAFGTTTETIPASIPYLRAASTDVAIWRDKLRGIKGKKIGLAWAGLSRAGQIEAVLADRRRSIPLAALAPLASIPGCSFISLQLGTPVQQMANTPSDLVLHDFTGDISDFADTAALIENLDLVISADTAPVHLAGALGKPTFLLNRFDTCWRWFTERNNTDWYPSMRIFRQPRPGDWDTPVRAIAETLRELGPA